MHTSQNNLEKLTNQQNDQEKKFVIGKIHERGQTRFVQKMHDKEKYTNDKSL